VSSGLVRARRRLKPAPEAQARPAASSNIADEIQRLAALKEQGILSDDEFAAAKAKLLGI